MSQEEIIRREAKALLRHMGGNEHKTISYSAIHLELGKREGVTGTIIEHVITALTAADYIFEIQGAGVDNLELGQRLRPKGRRMARRLRGEV